MKFKNFITPLHKASKRNYIKRMINKKVLCMGEAKKYSKNYWDGPRKYGYGDVGNCSEGFARVC